MTLVMQVTQKFRCQRKAMPVQALARRQAGFPVLRVSRKPPVARRRFRVAERIYRLIH